MATPCGVFVCYFLIFTLLNIISVTTIITGKTVAYRSPALRFPPAISESVPTMVGLTVAPRSPARARNANIAVPPLGQVAEEMLSEPGHMMPTARPQRAQPESPSMGEDERDATR